MTVKLRVLLKSANVDPGLVEITPFSGRPSPKPGQKLERVREGDRELDVDSRTREVYREYLRGVLSIELCFVSDAEQPTSFDDVRRWAEDYFERTQATGHPRLELTIDEVVS